MSLARIRGQARALRLLRPMLKSKLLPPALLFFGPEGVGKATAAVAFAKALNCLKPGPDGDCCDACVSCVQADKGIDPDLKRVNPAYQAGLREEEAERQRTIRVDTARHIIKDMEMTSMGGRWKVAVIEDAERLEIEAANALLKTLEEPPARALWILVTSRRERLLPTILSRCHRLPFSALPDKEVADILKEQGLDFREAERLSRLAEGSPGRALSLKALQVPDPEEWAGDPLAPFRLADSLPRELHLARPMVEAHLRRIARCLRERGGPSSRKTRDGLREISKLAGYLRSDVDPRLILELAALELR